MEQYVHRTSFVRTSHLDACLNELLLRTLQNCFIIAFGYRPSFSVESAVARLEEPDNHPEHPTLDLSCRRVFESGQRPTEVVGPLLEDEAAAVHEGVWVLNLSPQKSGKRLRKRGTGRSDQNFTVMPE